MTIERERRTVRLTVGVILGTVFFILVGVVAAYQLAPSCPGTKAFWKKHDPTTIYPICAWR